MRFRTDERFWVVVDPTPESGMTDVCFETSLRDLELQFRGGLGCEQHPALFTDRGEAEEEARCRLVGMQAALAIVREGDGELLRRASSVEILDREGEILLRAGLGEVRP